MDNDVIKTAWQVELRGRHVDGTPFYWRSKAVFVDKAEAEKWQTEVIVAQCKAENESALGVDLDSVTGVLIGLDVFL